MLTLIPCIRFAIALTIAYGLVVQALFELIIENDPIRLFTLCILGSLAISFVIYLVVTGVREIKRGERTGARYFRIFGLVFEAISFLGQLYVLTLFIQRGAPFWAFGIVLLILAGLLTLIVVDFGSMRQTPF